MAPLRSAAALLLALSCALPPAIARAIDLDDSDESALGDDDADDEDDVDPTEEAKRDDADRNHVAGTTEGSLASPVVLKDEARLAKLCDALKGPRDGRTDADPAELETAKRTAMRDVYTVTVQPGGFKIGDYRNRIGRLPLRLEHPFFALDGALRLIVAHKAGGSFEVPAKEASALLTAIEDKKLGLEVSFRIDGTMQETLSPCFSYPKSAAYALNVEPLSYTLIELANNNRRRIEQKTPALAKLKTWMAPGKARLSIVASSEGPLESEVLSKAIEAKREELEACFSAMMQSVSAVGMVAYEASVTPQGSIADVRVEAESLDDDAADACAQKVLAATSAGKAAKPSRAHVSLSVERGDEDSLTITD